MKAKKEKTLGYIVNGHSGPMHLGSGGYLGEKARVLWQNGPTTVFADRRGANRAIASSIKERTDWLRSMGKDETEIADDYWTSARKFAVYRVIKEVR